MRIALISKADHSGGGASKMAEDLRKMLLADGHEVVHWVSWSKSGYDSKLRRLYGERFQRKFYRWTRAVKSWFAPDVIPFELPNLFWQNLPANFDLVHIHDISFAASPLSVRYLAKRMPVLWTLHDCSAFTGGCIQPMDCTRYTTGCGQCPQHGLPPLDSRFDYSALKWRLNQTTLQAPGLQTAVPSQWLLQLLQHAAPLVTSPLLLPNMIDCQKFRPQSAEDKMAIRRQLSLAAKVPVVLLGAAQLANPYKGITDGLAALQLLANQGVAFQVLLVGAPSSQISSQFADLKPVYTGYIETASLMNDVYAAADVLLYPSLADNQPLQILEALAVNLPVIAYATGGIPDILTPIAPQWLVPTSDIAQLAAQLGQQLQQPAISLLEPRQYIQQHHSAEVSLQRHLQAYEQTISQWQAIKP